MISVQRILPYTKQLVLYALYDVLDSEESEYDKAENGRIAAKVWLTVWNSCWKMS